MKRSTGAGAAAGARRLAVAVAILATLAACGGTDEQDDGQRVVEEAIAEDEARGDTLSEKFGSPHRTDPASALTRSYDEQRVVEEAIAECMTGKGFEYRPVVYDRGEVPEYTDQDAVDRARTYGLGVSLAFDKSEYDEDRRDEVRDLNPRFGQFVIPNSEYNGSLSEAESTAFDEALHGTPEEIAGYETTEADQYSGETITAAEGHGAGCHGDTYRARARHDQQVSEAIEPFQTEITERVEADSRIADAQIWSACMADKGFDYPDKEAVWAYAEGPMRDRLIKSWASTPTRCTRQPT